VKNLKKIAKMTNTNQSEKANKRKIAMLTIFLVVLCVLGLSMIRPSYACANHSSVVEKAVTLDFTGAPVTGISVVDSYGPTTLSVSGSSPYFYFTADQGQTVTVTYTYVDVEGLTQTGTTSFVVSSGVTNCNIAGQVDISDVTASQIALKT
jgi:hypothetical protein